MYVYLRKKSLPVVCTLIRLPQVGSVKMGKARVGKLGVRYTPPVCTLCVMLHPQADLHLRQPCQPDRYQACSTVAGSCNVQYRLLSHSTEIFPV